MAISTRDAIFLGNFADADSNEVSYTLENPSVYLGTFGSVGAPLHQSIVAVTYDDADNRGETGTDDVTATETINYDLGGGAAVSQVDNLQVPYDDGSIQSFTNAVMFQDSSGNLVLTNSNFAGTDQKGAASCRSGRST